MMYRTACPYLLVVLSFTVVACRDTRHNGEDSARSSLPPVYPSGPSGNNNWDADAGPVMIVSTNSGGDSAAVVMPDQTDSTIADVQGISPPVAGIAFDLFGRAGRVASAVNASPLPSRKARRDCYSWPLAKLSSPHASWQVGFASGHAYEIRLDSIEGMSSTDSAALAAAIAQTAATLPAASAPTFRGLPFRVRSAYTFRLDSVEAVVADVVRSVNEEANPRLEHLLIVGERPASSRGKYDVGYFHRSAGAEESTEATEILAVVRIGSAKRPAVVINIEYDDGGKLGLIERSGPAQWGSTWRSAYTDC